MQACQEYKSQQGYLLCRFVRNARPYTDNDIIHSVFGARSNNIRDLDFLLHNHDAWPSSLFNNAYGTTAAVGLKLLAPKVD